MKIILHSNIAWTISNFRLELIKHFVSNGHCVICISDNDNFNENSVEEIVSAGGIFTKISIDRKSLNPLKDILYSWKLFKILRKEKPDIIFNYTIKPVIYGSIISRILRIRSIAVITGLGFVFIERGVLYKLIKHLYRFSLSKCFLVLFLNVEDKNEFINENIISDKKAFVLPGEGINTDFFSPSLDSNEPTKFVFLKICRLLWDKGLKEYFLAAEMMKAKYSFVEFQLLGFFDDGNPSGVTRKEILDLEQRGLISYLGVTNDVRKYISMADCVVLASYREGIPRTLLEAASMGKPIVTTNTVGCRNTVDNMRSGFLCNIRDHVDLYEKMELVVKMPPEDRKKMGMNGRFKIMREFSQIHVNDIYDRILSNVQF